MKKTVFSLLIGLLAFSTSFAQVKWEADPAHTNVAFSIGHFGLSFIDGQFTDLSGSVDAVSEENFDNAKIEFNIDVNSINTRVEARDTHLKSADFFDVDKYPAITFKNGVLKKGKKNKFTLTGDLTIKDVTKKVTFDVEQNNGIITDPWEMTRAGFTAKTKINRLDYNINFGADALPNGAEEIAKNVDITVNVEIVRK